MWNIRMEGLFMEKDQWIVVDLDIAPTRISTEDWEKLDRKEKRTIWLCL